MNVNILQRKRLTRAALLFLLLCVAGLTQSLAQNNVIQQHIQIHNGVEVLEFDITEIANFDERVIFLHNLLDDSRFDVITSETDGVFIISANDSFENMNLEEAFSDFRLQSAFQFSEMRKEEASETALEFKADLPENFVHSLMMDVYLRSGQNNFCALAEPFCTDYGVYTIQAGVNAGSGEVGPYYDCLYTTPNPAWYYMQIGNPGGFTITMESTPLVDIDYCCWGPFSDSMTPCPDGLTSDKVVSCCYCTAGIENCVIPSTAQTGEYYILIITNYSNHPCNISFSKTEGIGDTACEGIPITAIPSPMEGGTVSGSGFYDEGSVCTLTATANEYFAFVNWTKNGEVVSTNPTYSFTVTEASAGAYVANFVVNTYVNTYVGDGSTATSEFLPSYSFYKYTLSQQIYTAEEIGSGGGISSIAFYNSGSEKTRSYDIYLAHTEKTAFDSGSDWIAVEVSDRVFSGEVTMASDEWTRIEFDNLFVYNGTSNLVLVIDDNSGNYTNSPHMSCLVYEADGNQAIYEYTDGTNYDPYAPSEYSGTLLTVKNQIMIGNANGFIVSVAANPVQGGTVSGLGMYNDGDDCTLTATANEYFTFTSWTKGGEVVSTNPTYSFTVTEASAGAYVANFVVNTYVNTYVGDGSPSINEFLPSYSYYKYTLSQQIYTAEEIGSGGGISSIAFYNNGEEKTRSYDIYLAHTEKPAFDSGSDWITVEESDRVFSGEVTMASDAWTRIEFDNLFVYNGTSNLVLVVDDNSGNYTDSPHMSCLVYEADGNQAIYEYTDGTNYDPYAPSEYSGTLLTVKNQIMIGNANGFIISVAANPVQGGTVSGLGMYNEGDNCTLTATANEYFTFTSWTKDGEVVSTNPTYSFTVTEASAGAYVANFVVNTYVNTYVGDGGIGTNQFLPSYSYYKYTLSQQIYTAEEIGSGGGISSIAFYNNGSEKTRNYDIYLAHTEKTAFASGTDWIAVEESDRVFSGEVTMASDEWTRIEFDNLFVYNGTSNLVLVIDDNSGNYTNSPHMSCLVYEADGNQAIYEYTDGTNYDPYAPSEYSGILLSVKNQIMIGNPNGLVISAVTNPAGAGLVTGAGTYDYGTTATLTATANEGYSFINWTLGGEVVSNSPTYTFTVTEAGEYVANFELESFAISATVNLEAAGTVEGAGTYDYGTTATLTATANTGYTFINWTLGGEVVSNSPTYTFTVTEAGEYVANFELNSYAITTTVNPTSSGNVTGAGTYDHGTTATLTATANTGYTFINWTLGGEVVSNSPTYTFTVTEAGDYVANFALNSYVIAVEANPTEGGTVAGGGTYNHFVTCSLTATPNMGYTFVNWTKDGTVVSTNPTYSFTVLEDAAFVANFELNSYTITATANPTMGGTVTGGGIYYHMETATLTATPNTGYRFVNWTKNGTAISANPTFSFTVTEAADYEANFETYSYNITVMANPSVGGTVSGAGTYNHFATCTLTATANQGYTFLNWTKDGVEVSTNATYSFTVTEAGSYVANFELESYAITVTANLEAAGTVEGAGTYDYGTTATLTATANAGYSFVNWTKNGTVVSTEAVYSFTVTEAGSYVANFALNSYAITTTANPTAGGIVTGAGTYNHGATATLTVTANTGYTFINWTLGGEVVSNSPTYTFTVTEAGDYVANFELNSYVITVEANPTEGGTVTGGGTYNHFVTCSLTATPNEGYTFVNWTKDGTVVSTNATYSFTVLEEAAFVANFELNSYTITATANPTIGGTVTGGGTYYHMETATLTATPNMGYRFVNWTKNGTAISANPTFSFTVTEAADYVANFETYSYNIIATANPSVGGTVAGAGVYDYGETVTLTATPNANYGFVNWTENGVEVSTETTYSFTVTGSRSLVANFDHDYYWLVDPFAYESTMTIIGIVQINGEEQHSNLLEVGAFSGEECRGREWLTDQYYVDFGHYLVFLTVYGDNVSANEITFRLYDHAVGEEVDKTCVTTLLFESDAIYGSNANPFVFNFIDANVAQTANLSNGWNWWSSYIELDAESSLQSLESSLGTSGMMIKSQNDGYASYLAGFGWYGSLTTINNESTYQIRTNEACTVEMTGVVANPAEHPIELHSGWTWVGYPVAVSMGVGDAMAGIAPLNGDMLKSQNDGFASYLEGYGWYGSLNILNPGMGLMFKSNNANAVTLVYPTNGTRTDLKANQTAENNYWQPNLNAYPDNMSVMAVVELDGNELQGENFELAAFANGECRGSAKLMFVAPLNRYMAFLTVAGDEAAKLHFGLYNTETGVVETQHFASLQYETNAVVGSFVEPYVVSFRGNTGMDEWVNNVNLFPNPVERGQTVSFGIDVAETGEVLVEIINTLGAVVETQRMGSLQTITAPSTAGVYTLRITVEGKGMCNRKLVVR